MNKKKGEKTVFIFFYRFLFFFSKILHMFEGAINLKNISKMLHSFIKN